MFYTVLHTSSSDTDCFKPTPHIFVRLFWPPLHCMQNGFVIVVYRERFLLFTTSFCTQENIEVSRHSRSIICKARFEGAHCNPRRIRDKRFLKGRVTHLANISLGLFLPSVYDIIGVVLLLSGEQRSCCSVRDLLGPQKGGLTTMPTHLSSPVGMMER
jgi:hypothetical protein